MMAEGSLHIELVVRWESVLPERILRDIIAGIDAVDPVGFNPLFADIRTEMVAKLAALRRQRALIVRWSPANPYWWRWQFAMMAHQQHKYGVRY